MSIPHISKDLIDYLKKVFPDSLPEQPTTQDRYGLLIGQQIVIRHLAFQYQVQNRNILENT